MSSLRLPERREHPTERGCPPLGETGLAYVVAVMVLAALSLLVLWVGVVTTTGLAAIDSQVSAEVVANRPPWLSSTAVVVSDVGSPGVMIAFVAIAAILAARRLRRVAPLIAAAAGLAMLSVVDIGLKDTVARPRPPLAEWAMSTSGFSFPSGHAVFSLGALLLGALLLRWSGHWFERGDDTTRSRRDRALVVLATAFVAVVGISRIVVGVHYPSDVLAGWALAILVVGSVALAVQSWARQSPHRATPPELEYDSGSEP